MLKIILKNCGKNYHRTWLFRNVNFEFEIFPGNSLAVLGDNGSGKSTFTLLLTRQIEPTEGTIDWQGINSKEVHNYYALSSPSMELPEELTLEEWFEFQSEIKPFYKDVNLNQIIELCQFSPKVKSKSIMNFSSGMKQRVKLCHSFLTDSPLCILDEPLSNLDQKGIELYERLIAEYKSSKCIIVASNRVDEYQFCEHQVHIKDAQLTILK